MAHVTTVAPTPVKPDIVLTLSATEAERLYTLVDFWESCDHADTIASKLRRAGVHWDQQTSRDLMPKDKRVRLTDVV